MIYALLLDCEDSADFPNNDGAALGRPLSTYPLMAAKSSSRVARTYAVSSSPPVKSAAAQYGAVLIDPPAEAADPASHAEHLLRHGWRTIREDLKGESAPELLVVLFANCPTVTGALIEEGIEALQTRPELESAVSVSPYNRWNPVNARKIGADGTLEAYAAGLDGNAESWFPDWGVQVLRPASFAGTGPGQPPFPWLGRKVWPLKQWGGGPVDYQWQIPSAEYWLKKHGAADNSSSLEPQPKPQLAPKPDRR
ncbi:MAG: cytidylyltransferase [Elusimicrobia bacterium]|nr:cytidylyltransferase [Elusimicrobiota bacterium]